MDVNIANHRDKHFVINRARTISLGTELRWKLTHKVSKLLVNFVQRGSMLCFNILSQQNVLQVFLKPTHVKLQNDVLRGNINMDVFP